MVFPGEPQARARRGKAGLRIARAPMAAAISEEWVLMGGQFCVLGRVRLRKLYGVRVGTSLERARSEQRPGIRPVLRAIRLYRSVPAVSACAGGAGVS